VNQTPQRQTPHLLLRKLGVLELVDNMCIYSRTLQFTIRLFMVLIVLLMLLSCTLGWALAQEAGWSQPINLSNTPTFSNNALVVADQMGGVHVMWGERTTGDSAGALDTVYYTRLVDGQWTPPIDILAVADGEFLSIDAFQVDSFGRLLVLWHSNQGLALTTSETIEPASARDWSTTFVDSGATLGAAMAFDANAVGNVLSVSPNREVIYFHSSNGGLTWDPPQIIGTVDRNDAVADQPTMATDGNGMVYASWTINDGAANWTPAGVWFARSTDGGQSWSAPLTLSTAEGHGDSQLMVDRGGRVHLTWIGNLGSGGRYHRTSDDQGQTWSEVITVAPPERLRGYAGASTIVQDSADGLHMILSGLGDGRDRTWYSKWLGSGWSEPQHISADSPDSQLPSATLALGHLIHVVWTDFSRNEISYAWFDTGAPAVNTAPLPFPAQQEVAGVQGIQPVSGELRMTQTVPAQPQTLLATDAPYQRTISSTMILAISAAPGLLLIMGVIILKMRRQRSGRG
jgi:hypothetical protein